MNQRYIFQNKFVCDVPKINQLDKTVVITISVNMKDCYDTALIDFYSAPSQDEWRRYHRFTFGGLRLISSFKDDYAPPGTNSYEFNYDKYDFKTFGASDALLTENIPLGKLKG